VLILDVTRLSYHGPQGPALVAYQVLPPVWRRLGGDFDLLGFLTGRWIFPSGELHILARIGGAAKWKHMDQPRWRKEEREREMWGSVGEHFPTLLYPTRNSSSLGTRQMRPHNESPMFRDKAEGICT